MTVRELRQMYLEFFEHNRHRRHASASLVPYDVNGDLDTSLLFTGAGMVQFKPYFRGTSKPEHTRLVNVQKCLRTGDIEEVGDESHLTFFEMLGNFSFGDYFKKEAIELSWEFLTSDEWLGLDPKKLAFTVFETDEEAYELWAEKLRAVGIEPSTRIFRLGEKTNFWPAGSYTAGPPGPCGMNSEIFYWTPEGEPPQTYDVQGYLKDEAEGKWLEIWNNVFIQFEWQGRLKNPSRPDQGYEKTGMPELPFRSVDTGMGLERTVAVLSAKRSVYDTDAFQPILRKLHELTGVAYGDDEATDRAMRIIADHVRSASFCVADGILPGNTGRGYVLRRLIRRAVLVGRRYLKQDGPFFAKIWPSVQESVDHHYPEIDDRAETVSTALEQEENQFLRNLQDSEPRVQAVVADLLRQAIPNYDKLAQDPSQDPFASSGSWPENVKALLVKHGENYDAGKPETWPVLSGEHVFRLYDTFGFPVEVTREMASYAGLAVDMEGFYQAMAEAQERSRGASGMETVYGTVQVKISALFSSGNGKQGPTPTDFVGYGTTEAEAKIMGAMPMVEEGRPTREVVLALDKTPFYAESGGQVSDTGVIEGKGFAFRVLDVTKQDGVYVHLAEPLEFDFDWQSEDSDALTQQLNKKLLHQPVEAKVDRERRLAIQRNHTATHLLHAALREELGPQVAQAGSLVAENHLRFDFTHNQALSPEQLQAVEQRVNEYALAAEPVTTYADIPLEEAKQMGAMALFGEKYADRVRVVQVGEMPPQEPSFSRELCGGTHVRTTGEIGLFKIVSEASAASGVRRIEALTGTGAYYWVRAQNETVRTVAEKLKSNPQELDKAVDKMLEALKEERKKREQMARQGSVGEPSQSKKIGEVEWVVQSLTDIDAKEAQLVADRLAENQPDRAVLVSTVAGGKVMFVCKVGEGAKEKGAHAGNIIKAAAQAVGGGGGGRPDFATAGGKNAEAVPQAIQSAADALRAQVS
jgi:alanyl-tRNA synthetase